MTRLTTLLAFIYAAPADVVTAQPEVGNLPGGDVLQDITNGVMGWALVGCLVALLVSAAMWALGSNSSNVRSQAAGKRGVLVSGAASLVIGAGPTIINFLFDAGQA